MDAAAVVALAGALQGGVLAVALWKRSTAALAANRWLALLMALASLRLVNQFAYRSPLPGTVPLSPRFTVPLLFTFAPLLFLYLRTLVRPAAAARGGDWVHSLPALAVLAYCAPFYWAVVRKPPEVWGSYGQALRWESTALNGVLAVQMGWYLARIRQLLPAYDGRAREVASDLDAVRYRWTRWLAWALLAELVVLVLVIALQLLGVGGALVARRDLVLAGLVALTLYGAGYMALVQPALFVDEGEEGEPGRKYARSSLTEARAEEGARLIRELMASERLYADDDLTLAGLSARVGMPAAQVSQVINERMGSSFYDMVNGYRVEEAKGRLLDREARQRKILAVGLEVGFRSKAAFNRIFKLKTGMTPSEFRARAAGESPARSTSAPRAG
jgi:AraC-like DNA-binding protein/ABC-type amino acid transport system permease subunit